MANSTPIVLTFPSVQAPTQAEANAKQRAMVVDCIKQNLANLNALLAARQVPEPPVTLAGVDAANNATLLRWLTIIFKDFARQSGIAWRASVAAAAATAPILTAPPEMDEVP